MATDHMTNPPMRFENGLETQPPPPPACAGTADTDVVNSDTYDADLKLAHKLVKGKSVRQNDKNAKRKQGAREGNWTHGQMLNCVKCP